MVMMSRRTIVIVGFIVALALVPAIVARTSRAGHYVAPAPVCGTARWPVKTLSTQPRPASTPSSRRRPFSD